MHVSRVLRAGQSRLFRQSRVSYACKQVARYIQAHGLKVGDKLPPQLEMCRELGFCHNVLSPAMRVLTDMGLLSRRRSRGTEIVNLDPLNCITWTVGLAVIDLPIQGPGAFHAWLTHALQSELAKRHCTSHNYFLVEKPHFPRHQLEDFPGLAEDVANRFVDGVIVVTSLLDSEALAVFEQAGIPVLVFSNVGNAHKSLVISPDTSGVITDATAELVGQGARRLAVVSNIFVMRAYAALVRRLARSHIDRGLVMEQLLVSGGVKSGEEAALALLERPASQRPDALIIIDDFTALGMARVLAARGDYAPRIAVQANRQLPLTWPLPVMRYELDIGEFAAQAVKMLQESLLNPSLSPRWERVPARLAEEDIDPLRLPDRSRF